MYQMLHAKIHPDAESGARFAFSTAIRFLADDTFSQNLENTLGRHRKIILDSKLYTARCDVCSAQLYLKQHSNIPRN